MGDIDFLIRQIARCQAEFDGTSFASAVSLGLDEYNSDRQFWAAASVDGEDFHARAPTAYQAVLCLRNDMFEHLHNENRRREAAKARLFESCGFEPNET